MPEPRKPEGTIYRRPSPIQFDMFDTGNISLDSDGMFSMTVSNLSLILYTLF